ncbi:hypothetical protein [Alkaliflexus imshenetskii]|uniref:hypothetical protein n=1 Tax=Alkaliflexus imshenetskii TaxID=286730 RepID=UPI0012FA9A0F|nr:hypothetical protein [Alkaliflexus imshenetskii]
MDEIKIFKVLAYLLIIVIIALCNSGKDSTPPALLDMNESIYPLDYNKTLKAGREPVSTHSLHAHHKDSTHQLNHSMLKNLYSPSPSDSTMQFIITLQHLSSPVSILNYPQ